MSYDLDEFSSSGSVNNEGIEAEAKAAEAEKASQAAIEATKKEKEALEARIKTLEGNLHQVNSEHTAFKKRISGESDAPVDPYDDLRRAGVKEEELKGFEKFQGAWFKKEFGVDPAGFKERYNMTAQNSNNASSLTSELNYDKTKAKLFDDIQAGTPEIRVDYFANRLEELESAMKPEQLAAFKSLPPQELMKALKQTYYNEIGFVKADKDGISKYKQYQEEADKGAKSDKENSSNKGAYSSNIARKMKESDFEGKEVSLQSAVNRELFS